MLAAMSISPATGQVYGPAIQVQGLEKSFKELRGVDFEVARGSIFALLGSNGAGKTTVVKILSTLLKADGGTARVNGFDVAAQAAGVRESISLTGQFAAVDEVLSGRENLVLVARLRHLKDPGAIADALLGRCSLTGAGARRAATYSGGMRRRLDLAMSLIGTPPVVFFTVPYGRQLIEVLGLQDCRFEYGKLLGQPPRLEPDGSVRTRYGYYPVDSSGLPAEDIELRTFSSS